MNLPDSFPKYIAAYKYDFNDGVGFSTHTSLETVPLDVMWVVEVIPVSKFKLRAVVEEIVEAA